MPVGNMSSPFSHDLCHFTLRWNLGFARDTRLIEVNIHAKYKQDCSMHVKNMGWTSFHKNFDPFLCFLNLCDNNLEFACDTCLIEANINAKYKQDCMEKLWAGQASI
jgi:hypothetical protein